MSLPRHPLVRALALGLVAGALGAGVGMLVASSRGAELTSGAAWGLYIAGALLLFFGAAPSLAPPPAAAVLATLPEGARDQVVGRQQMRIRGAPWMLLNFIVAAALIGVGALLEIYG